jgi:hypothetical protein
VGIAILDSVPLSVSERRALSRKRPLTLSSVLADETAVHVYRHQVAEALALDWPQRAKGLRSCGEAGAVLYCAECDRGHVVPYRCNARSCPTCAHIASAVVVEKLAKRAEKAVLDLNVATTWDYDGKPQTKSWRLITPTQQTAHARGDDRRFHPRELRRSILRVRRSWGPFWRSLSWGRPRRVKHPETGKPTMRARRDTMFAMGIEVAPGGLVHAHAAVYGEYLPGPAVTASWEKFIDRRGRVGMERLRMATPDEFRKSLHEVLKYVSKGEPNARQSERAAMIELAMRGIRRVEMGGALRKISVSSKDIITTTAPPCVECGTVQGKWRWGGLRAPEYVTENGGFGVDRWADIRDHTRQSHRATLYESYFGGEAPPWMSDDAEELPGVELAYS